MGRGFVNLGASSTPSDRELRLNGFCRRACGRTRTRFAPRCQLVTCQRPGLVGVDGVELLGEVRRRRKGGGSRGEQIRRDQGSKLREHRLRKVSS
jgi:hypothetical protein